MTDHTADYRTTPPKITPVATAWQAWWEDHDMWDGDMLYADLDTAKHHSAVAYVGEEYAWLPGDDPDDEAPDRTLAWEPKYGRWRLLDNGQDTGVRLGETRTYAVSAGVAPATSQTTPSQRAGLRDELRRAICEAEGFAWDSDMLEPDEYGDHADTVLAVLYREWPWLRAEAEDATTDQTALRDCIAEALWQKAEYDIVAEWICCDPIDLSHTLCMQGGAAMRMIKSLIFDGDRTLADAVLAVLPATTDRAAVLREAADLYANLTDQNEAYDLAENGAIDEESRIRYDTVRDVVAGLRRMAAEAGPADTVRQDDGEAPADPWSISYHQLGPARNNPAVCTCGLGPDAVIHNEPPHQFNGRPKPGMPPVWGICTDCHHHETAACHTKPEQPAAAQPKEA